jgi:hypothetical protein
MKRNAFVGAVLVGLVSVACERPATRTADAGAPSAAPPATAATPAPAATAPGLAEATPEPRSVPAAETKPRSEPARPAPRAPVAPEPAQPAAAAPTPEATPEPAPTPKPRIVASGTPLEIVLQQTLSTKTAQAEDAVVAELAKDVTVGDDVLLPAGSEVHGTVVSAVRSGRVKGRARLVVAFKEIRVGNRSYEIEATGFDVTAGSSKGRDAKIAGGAAAAGAIIGGIADGGSGALKGGIIGGAAGGAAVLATRGQEVELPKGSSYTIKLQKALRLR